MWNGKKVSIVLPAYNEEENIRRAIEDFSLPCVDEIIVVDNNSTDGTPREVEKTKAKLIFERKQGYGNAIQRGLRDAGGDLMIVAEPDGTFVGKDVMKFLGYVEDFDFIVGTRTTKELIESGANMDFFIRVGNWFLGKVLSLLFHGPRISDVGCTFRLITREALGKIELKFTVGGSHFSPEMIALGLMSNLRMIEIPISYRKRVGVSKITGKKVKAFKLGLVMLWSLIALKLKSLRQ